MGVLTVLLTFLLITLKAPDFVNRKGRDGKSRDGQLTWHQLQKKGSDQSGPFS